MKCIKILFCLIVTLSLSSFNAKAQYADYFIDYPKQYVGIGTGVESISGILGVSFEHILLDENKTIMATAGIGLWGYKLSGTIRYYRKKMRGLAIDGGMSFATGIKNIEYELLTDMPGGYQLIRINQLTATTINFGVSYYWMLKNTNRISVRFGYGIQTKEKRYEIINRKVVLSEEAEYFLYILQPGGFSAGLLFDFHL